MFTMTRKMNIGIVSWHSCIRALKQCVVLQEKGYNLHLVAHLLVEPKLFETCNVFTNASQFEQIIRNLSKIIDVWHVHNEPNWFIPIIRKVCPNTPIIHDHHDSQYWRVSKEITINKNEPIEFYIEDVADSLSDAFIVPSESCKNEMIGRIGDDREIIFVPSALPKKEFQIHEFDVRGGLVMEGGVVTREYAEKNPWVNWRDYTDIMTYCQSNDIQTYLYSASFGKANPDIIKEYYEKLGCACSVLPYGQLIHTLSSHTWSLVGNWFEEKETHPVWSFANPNKFWDSMAAGLPVVVMNCPEVAALVEKYDIGIVVDHPLQIKERWSEHTEKRINVLLRRDELCIDPHIEKIENLYKELCGREIPGRYKKLKVKTPIK